MYIPVALLGLVSGIFNAILPMSMLKYNRVGHPHNEVLSWNLSSLFILVKKLLNLSLTKKHWPILLCEGYWRYMLIDNYSENIHFKLYPCNIFKQLCPFPIDWDIEHLPPWGSPHSLRKSHSGSSKFVISLSSEHPCVFWVSFCAEHNPLVMPLTYRCNQGKIAF